MTRKRKPKIAPSAPRMKALRERNAQAGGRTVTVILSPAGAAALDRLRLRVTTSRAVEDALLLADAAT